MIYVFPNKFDRAEFWRHFLAGLAVALVVAGVASHHVPMNVVETRTVENASYGRMVADPLVVDDAGGLRHRMLMPLIAFLTRLSGVETNAVAFVIFLAMLYAYVAVMTGLRLVAALAVVALSNTSFFTTFLKWPIFPDPVSYVLLMLALIYVDRPAVWPFFYGLTLFNHEMGIFSFLFFMLLQLKRGDGVTALLRSARGVGGMIVLYLVFRVVLKAHFIEAESCGVDYFFNIPRFFRAINDNFLTQIWWKAFVYSYKFNLVLLAAAWWLLRRETGLRRLVTFPLVESVLFMVVASDLSRLANHAFLAYVVAVVVVARRWGGWGTSALLAGVFGLNFLIRSHVYWGIGW